MVEHEVFPFRALAWDTTLRPREAAMVRYELSVPASAVPPLTVELRLMHRTRADAVQRAACAVRRADDRLDPCPPQPLTELARAATVLDGHGPALRWETADRRALAWSGARQDQLVDARDAAAAALALARPGYEQLRSLALVAAIAARRGRVDDAVRDALGAGSLAAPSAALARVRGDAWAQRWDWGRALIAYRELAERAPRDPRAHAAAAIAAGSARQPLEALAHAARGLALAPRDPDLLRAQALALVALGSAEAERALDAYDVHRERDEAPQLRQRCFAEVEGCAREASPAHAHPTVAAREQGLSHAARTRERAGRAD